MNAIDINLGEAYVPLLDDYQYFALFGGRGTGKSHAVVEALVVQSMMNTEFILCARQFQNSISESAKSLIESKIKQLKVTAAFRILDREIVHVTSDSRFVFKGLERNPESVQSFEGITRCFVEEARTVNQRSLDILMPTIRDLRSRAYFVWNPKYKTDPVDVMFRGEHPPDNAYIKEVTYLDNPWWYQTNMPQQKATLLLANKNKHDHIWDGSYDEVGEARIFTNTRVGRVDVPYHIDPVFGLDFGSPKSTSDPNALIKAYVIEEQNIIYIAREAYGRVSLRDLDTLISTVDEYDKYEIVADNSRPETIDYLNTSDDYDMHVTASRKGAGSLKAGIEWLQGFNIVIDPDCPYMREEAQSYCWKVDPHTQLILPVPTDTDNHCWDALRYATECYRGGRGGGGVTVIGGKRT